MEGPCAASQKDWCGWAGIAMEDCRQLGCCYDANTPECFFSPGEKQSLSQICNAKNVMFMQ